MRLSDIGDVLMLDGDAVHGIVTDRDIVVRALAADRDPATTTIGEIASRDPVTIGPDEPAAHAVQLMRDGALRRLPVCEDGHLVGVVTSGQPRHRARPRVRAGRHQRGTARPLTATALDATDPLTCHRTDAASRMSCVTRHT